MWTILWGPLVTSASTSLWASNEPRRFDNVCFWTLHQKIKHSRWSRPTQPQMKKRKLTKRKRLWNISWLWAPHRTKRMSTLRISLNTHCWSLLHSLTMKMMTCCYGIFKLFKHCCKCGSTRPHIVPSRFLTKTAWSISLWRDAVVPFGKFWAWLFLVCFSGRVYFSLDSSFVVVS